MKRIIAAVVICLSLLASPGVYAQNKIWEPPRLQNTENALWLQDFIGTYGHPIRTPNDVKKRENDVEKREYVFSPLLDLTDTPIARTYICKRLRVTSCTKFWNLNHGVNYL